MLIKDFYEVNTFNSKEDMVTASIVINDKHSIFNGHFPNNPVMPGVCMMQIIKELTERALDVELFMSKASNVKFMALINPEKNKNLDLELKISREDDIVKVKNSTKFDDTLALKFSGTYKVIS